ncbi:hypothetical protein S7335_3601 [Synechococcus sp. PCC 7335]|nr:hypothetical protein S7335_3601 [Synechococcus sp. PCC 7335]
MIGWLRSLYPNSAEDRTNTPISSGCNPSAKRAEIQSLTILFSASVSSQIEISGMGPAVSQ